MFKTTAICSAAKLLKDVAFAFTTSRMRKDWETCALVLKKWSCAFSARRKRIGISFGLDHYGNRAHDRLGCQLALLAIG